MMTNVNKCGKATQILRAGYNYYYKRYLCKDVRCESCGSVIQNNVQNRLDYYVHKYTMNKFFTITTASDYKDLMKFWKSVSRQMHLLNKDNFISRHVSYHKISVEEAEMKYNDYIVSLIDYELKCFYLFEYDGLKYKNYNNIFVKITNAILNGTLTSMPEFKSLSRYSRSVILKNVSKYSKKMISMSPVEKFNFFNHFKDLFFALIDTGEDDVVLRRLKMRSRIYNNISSSDFQYVWLLEFQANGNPHIHILSNYYFNYNIVHSFWSESTNITKNVDMDLWEGDNVSRNVSKYVTKYITKDTIATKDRLESMYGKRVDIMGSSRGISLDLNYPKMEVNEADMIDGLRHVQTLDNSVPPSSFGEIGNLKEFKQNLKTSHALVKNSILKSIHDKYAEVSKIENSSERRVALSEFNIEKDICCINLINEEIGKRSLVPSVSVSSSVDVSSLSIDGIQKSFINAFLDNSKKFVMLLGKAGTGKSTSIKYLFDSVDLSGYKVEVVSFTGKASSVIGNITGLEGKTIHRMAGAKFNNLPDFTHGENNPIDADIVIIDEIGMCDTMTFASFLNCLKPECKVVLIGDKNQLNPIQSSNVIDVFLSSEDSSISVVELKTNYRSQDGVNKIAMDVLSGYAQALDYSVLDIDKVLSYISNGYQIISNSNRMCNFINTAVSATKDGIKIVDYVYERGDSAMIIKNNASKGLFNGDVVTIVSYDADYVYVSKPGDVFNDVIKYNMIDAYQSIRPSECITIHKSQGSGYNKVLVVLDNHAKLLNKNLLYTAVTRAESEVVLMISDKSLDLELLTKNQEFFYNGFSDIE